MSILVTGSLAYDRIAVFPDRFRAHILPDLTHRLNLSFTVKKMTVHFGGTAGNIAYNLRLLGEDPVILGTVGDDFDMYRDWLKQLGIARTAIKIIEGELTAHATIMTDLDDNQITAFYAGAMDHAHEAKVSVVKEEISLAIVAPNGIRAMTEYARELKEKKVPYIADPGQGIPAMRQDELRDIIEGSLLLVANDYEWALIQEKTGWTKVQCLEKTKNLIVTLGANGATLSGAGQEDIHVAAFPANPVVDPTGCGDALRAGLMYGIKNNLSMERCLKIGSWLAAKCVSMPGTQNHKVSQSEFTALLKSL